MRTSPHPKRLFIVCSLVLVLAAWSASVALGAPPSPHPDELLREQGAGLLEGRRDEVLQSVDETLNLYEELGDLHGQAAALLLRGLARWGERGGDPTALDLARSLAILDQVGDPLGAWLVVWALAESASTEGQPLAAEGHFRDGLERLAEVRRSSDPLDFQGFRKIGGAWGGPVETLDAMEGSMEAVAAFAKPILLTFLEVPLRAGLVGALTEQARFEDAQAELDRAFEAATWSGGLFDSTLLMRQGHLQRRQWRLDEARKSFEDALNAPAVIPGPPNSQGGLLSRKALDALAEIETLGGRFEAALVWNDRALREARDSKDRVRESTVLEDRADILQSAGDLDGAETTLKQSLTVAEEADSGFRRASVLGALGILAMTRGRYAEAASYLEGSFARLRDLEEPYVAAPILLLLVEVYQILGAHDRTADLLEQARALAAEGRFSEAAALAEVLAAWNRFVNGEATWPEMRRSLESLVTATGPLVDEGWPVALVAGLVAMGSGEPEAAEEIARGVLATSRSPLGTALARFQHGMALLAQGRHDVAESELTEAAAALAALEVTDMEGMAHAAVAGARRREGSSTSAVDGLEDAVAAFETVVADIRVEELLASFLGGERGILYDLLVDLLAATEHPREAFLQAERSRARAALRLLANQRFRPLSGTDSVTVARADALRAQIGTWERDLAWEPPGQVEWLERDLAHARSDYEDLQVRLKIQSPEYGALAGTEPVPAAKIQEILEPEVTLVSYFLSRGGGYAWILERDRFEMVSISLTPDDRSAIVCWSRELGMRAGAARGVARNGECGSTDDLDIRLYRLLISPLAAMGSLGQRLVIVPHSSLHYLPFAALRNPATGRYLVEDHEITLVPSASVLTVLRDRRSDFEGRALVLGEPSIEDPRLLYLPGTRVEAVEVAKLLDTVPLLGSEATEAAVYATSGQIDLLHIAAHGVRQPDAPRFSRLALAPGGDQDGNLEVHEIFSHLDLTGVDLVVLSACETAAGPDVGGDEIVSLARAFLYAGSSAVLATLWPVDDQASVPLIGAFYRRLLRGELPAAALRAAQVERLREAGAPVHEWAGYTLTGDLARHLSPAPVSLGGKTFGLPGTLTVTGAPGTRRTDGRIDGDHEIPDRSPPGVGTDRASLCYEPDPGG